ARFAWRSTSTSPPSFIPRDCSPTYISSLSLHDALPIWPRRHRESLRGPARIRRDHRGHHHQLAAIRSKGSQARRRTANRHQRRRSEEHTSELQSPCNLVCRLLLEKKKYEEYLESSAFYP